MASLFQLASLSMLFSFLLCCQADLIADICSQSKLLSPSRCAQILRSDPQTRGADLLTLGQIVIKKAEIAVNNTVTLAKAVQHLNNTGIVSVCRDVCSRAIDELNKISQMLQHLDERIKGDLPIKLSAAVHFVGTCDDAFEESVQGMPPEVKEASRIAQGHILVVLIIATKL